MCVLRASGVDFDPERYLELSQLDTCQVYHRGELRFPNSKLNGSRFEWSGIGIPVSEASSSDLPAQVADAEQFLLDNHAEIQRLTNIDGVTSIVLDFPVDLRIDGQNVLAQFDRFPASLVRIAGELGLGLEISVYPTSETPS